MGKTVLIVAAHPDDEILGCGGTIARHTNNGDDVHILILAEGATSRILTRDDNTHDEQIEALRQAARNAAKVLGAHEPRFAGLPDNRMDSQDLLDTIKAVETVAEEICPSIVYTHHGSDLNIDHQITHQAVLTACRPLPGSSVVRLHTFETLSSTEWASASTGPAFSPNMYVDISNQMKLKMQALKCYEAEMRPFPHARSYEAIEALSTLRGASVSVRNAEAFMTIRDIVK